MFDLLKTLSSDPLLSLITRYKEDTNPNKIDLGVGVYKDGEGETPVLPSVKAAETAILADEESKAYVGPLGNLQFNELLARYALGDSIYEGLEGKLSLIQTPGGCGALRIGAELIVRAKPACKVWVSDPTWPNHVPLLSGAGIEIATYPYYDYDAHSVRFDAMVSSLEGANAGDVVLLHGCCHNPSGADLSEHQWTVLAELFVRKGLVPFVDLAYQGFGDSPEQDTFGLRLMVDSVQESLFAISCSKNFGLYRERVGLAGLVSSKSGAAKKASGNMIQIARGLYSMPPSHGASVAAMILEDKQLKSQWTLELEGMRARISDMRLGVVNGMQARGFAGRFDFIVTEKGMFSFLGISPSEVEMLINDYAIYMAGSGRICVAGLNSHNLDYFCDALAAVAK